MTPGVNDIMSVTDNRTYIYTTLKTMQYHNAKLVG